MERNRCFFGKGHRDVAGNDRIAAKFYVGDRALTARVNDTNAAQFSVRLPSCFNEGLLAGEQFVLVGIAQFSQDGVLLTRLVAASRQINHLAVNEFCGVWSVKSTRHKIGIWHALFGQEAGTINVSIGRGLYPFNGKAD